MGGLLLIRIICVIVTGIMVHKPLSDRYTAALIRKPPFTTGALVKPELARLVVKGFCDLIAAWTPMEGRLSQKAM